MLLLMVTDTIKDNVNTRLPGHHLGAMLVSESHVVIWTLLM